MKSLTLAFAALLALGGAAQAAGFIVPAERRYAPFSDALPSCDDPGVVSEIAARFGATESNFWASSLEIAGLDKIHEIGFRANGLAYIPRRFCVARAALNDRTFRPVVYRIQASLGFVGWGRGVEWCVVGLDRNLAYSPACSALRPYVERFLGERALTTRY